jgi:NADH-quinone oxidoreductase subunit L
MLMGLSTGLVILTIVLPGSGLRIISLKKKKGFGKVLENKWYVDELYDKIIANPLNKLAVF